MRTLPTMYLILALNLTLLQGTVPSTRLYSNAHNTLQSLVSPLYSHIPRALLHIPSTPLNRPCAPIYPRTFYISPLLSCIVFVSQISPYPSTYPLHSFVSSFHSHIYPYPSTYTLYSLVSSFFSHISQCPSTYPLYYLPSSLYSHMSQYPSTYPLYSHMSSLFSHVSPCFSTYTLYSLVSSLHSYIFLSSYNTLNEFAGQRSRKFLGKITEQAILPSQSFKEVINKRPCS